MSEHNHLTGPHYGLGSVNHRALRNLIGNRPLNFVGLVAGSSAQNVAFDAFGFLVGGRAYEKAEGTNEALAILDYYGDEKVQAKDTTCFYVVSVNAAGVENVTKGKDGELITPPGIADTECPIGIIKVVTVAVTFTIGTTSTAASGVTSTFYDYCHLPVALP